MEQYKIDVQPLSEKIVSYWEVTVGIIKQKGLEEGLKYISKIKSRNVSKHERLMLNIMDYV